MNARKNVGTRTHAGKVETYRRIESAIAYIESHKTERVALRDVAASVNLSEYHFHRLFSRWAGTTPERFFKYLKKEYILTRLDDASLTDTTYRAGFSNPSRLHDLFITYEAMSPGEYRRCGEGLEIRFGVHSSPCGPVFIACTLRGIVTLRFLESADEAKEHVESLSQEFPRSNIEPDPAWTKPKVVDIFSSLNSKITSDSNTRNRPFHLLLHGTNFQIKVWEALLRIPPGSVATYGGIAAAIGMPTAARAVGTAVGRNPIAYLIPCHRVIRRLGVIGQYRWGRARKAALLGLEFALDSAGSVEIEVR